MWRHERVTSNSRTRFPAGDMLWRRVAWQRVHAAFDPYLVCASDEAVLVASELDFRPGVDSFVRDDGNSCVVGMDASGGH
jgi:hypothetical protein